ncbi:hypothetical protein PLESTB_000175700 [Pleodorina starrii]|uniref:Uncharacterized protein n=1 Tax=Pleodorina starrii TaxID=330485 RepID=A0A9W6BBL9_9CHLO|nr:hypothetical protein PLESTB_000175700 [Pleodorina starrii]GLC66167.1 hypothetical protein PLESTF_000392200 [Pleodorina starrii]
MNYQDAPGADEMQELPPPLLYETDEEGFSSDEQDEMPGLAESESSASGADSDDDGDGYGQATNRGISEDALRREQDLPAPVSVDMSTAVQRGCLLYALPESCTVHECATKAEHFQTMDCLALVPRPPPPPPPPAASSRQPAGGAAAAPCNGARPTLPGAAVGSGAGCPRRPAAEAAAAATPIRGASGCGGAAAAYCAQMPPPAGAPADEDLEFLVGGPRRLTIYRLAAAGPSEQQQPQQQQQQQPPGPPLEVCSCPLDAHHYSLAVSPDGRFVAAGSEHGYVSILAYVRETPGGGGTAAAAAAAAADPSAPSTSASPAASPSQPASLTPCATFSVPANHNWGMNNMIRFGSFGGATRLIVATQDRIIYLFNVPPWDGSAASLPRVATPAAFLTTGLPRWASIAAAAGAGAAGAGAAGAGAAGAGAAGAGAAGAGAAAAAGAGAAAAAGAGATAAAGAGAAAAAGAGAAGAGAAGAGAAAAAGAGAAGAGAAGAGAAAAAGAGAGSWQLPERPREGGAGDPGREGGPGIHPWPPQQRHEQPLLEGASRAIARVLPELGMAGEGEGSRGERNPPEDAVAAMLRALMRTSAEGPQPGLPGQLPGPSQGQINSQGQGQGRSLEAAEGAAGSDSSGGDSSDDDRDGGASSGAGGGAGLSRAPERPPLTPLPLPLPSRSRLSSRQQQQQQLRYPNAGAAEYWRRQRLRPSATHINVGSEPCMLVTPGGRQRAANPMSTCAVSGFHDALNAAVTSPDGAWLAVGCDAPLLFLLPTDPDYRSKVPELLLVPLPPSRTNRLEPGCQYLAFNSDSDRLAASFDALFAVLVYDVPRRQLLFSLRHPQSQPPLAVAFVPGHRSLLLHATDREHLVAIDVDQPRTSLTRITLKSPSQRTQDGQQQRPGGQQKPREPPPRAPQGVIDLFRFPEDAGSPPPRHWHPWLGGPRRPPRERRPRITGLLLAPNDRLLVSTKDELFSFQLLLPNSPWSRAAHRHMPSGFKAAVRALLTVSRARDDGDGGGAAAASAAAEIGHTAGASSEATAAAAAAAPPPAPLPRPTGLWSLPGDTLEAVVAAAARDRLAWVETDAASVLAFPILEFWEAGTADQARDAAVAAAAPAAAAAAGGASSSRGGSGQGGGAAAGVSAGGLARPARLYDWEADHEAGWRNDLWVAWHAD